MLKYALPCISFPTRYQCDNLDLARLVIHWKKYTVATRENYIANNLVPLQSVYTLFGPYEAKQRPSSPTNANTYVPFFLDIIDILNFNTYCILLRAQGWDFFGLDCESKGTLAYITWGTIISPPEIPLIRRDKVIVL